MANITVLALDPQTGDLCFDANGMLMLREDAEAIAQNVRNNLLTWKGEFPLNTDHGECEIIWATREKPDFMRVYAA